VENIVQPVSSPTNAIVPMDYQYVPPAVETPAFTPYVNENIKLIFLMAIKLKVLINV